MEAAAQLAGKLVAAACLSAVLVLVLARCAQHLGVVDAPGGRKRHAASVPLVGGLAIYAALLTVSWVTGLAPRIGYFLFALSMVIAVGFWDDVAEILPRIKFAIQIVASAIMIWGAGIELRSVGDLIGWRSIGLSAFAIPMTVFAIVGVVNSINMMDGLDGLAGSVSLAAFAWYAVVAAESGLADQSLTALLMCAALSGFLAFNLRFPWRPQALVFLGDAGSLMLGFALGWFALDLTQGPGRTFPPIAALWVLMVPLVDCVSLMVRRIGKRRSPFVADRHHIHHYLLSRGFTPRQTLAILVVASSACGAIGFAGWHFQFPESTLFYPFFFGFFAYHAWIQRAWDKLELSRAGAPSVLPPVEKDKTATAS